MVEMFTFAWWVFFLTTTTTLTAAGILLAAGFEDHEAWPGLSGIVFFTLTLTSYFILFGVIE
jgi:hypothetical protein